MHAHNLTFLLEGLAGHLYPEMTTTSVLGPVTHTDTIIIIVAYTQGIYYGIITHTIHTWLLLKTS